MARVIIYTQSNCKISDKFRQLLDSMKMHYIEKDITYDVLLKREMIERTGGKATTPQIFMEGRHFSSIDEFRKVIEN